MNTLGNNSKTVFLATEQNKITFEATASAAIKKGQPVKLTSTGQLAVWAPTDLRHLLIGYAYNDAASGELVTVWSRGYAIIYGLAAATQAAGPVAYTSYDNATTVGGVVGYSKYAVNATAEQNNAWALENAGGANELIQILLMD